jgi:hypothetical protein
VLGVGVLEGQRGDGARTSFFRSARVFSLLFATLHRRTTTKLALEPPGIQQTAPRRASQTRHTSDGTFSLSTRSLLCRDCQLWNTVVVLHRLTYHSHDVSRSAFIGGRALRGLEAPVVPTVFLSRIPLLSIRQDFGTPMSTFLTHSLPCLEWVMANPHH